MPGLPDCLAMSHGTNGPVAYEDVRNECFLDRERQGMLRTDRRIGELMSRHGWSMAVRWLLPYAHSLGLPVHFVAVPSRRNPQPPCWIPPENRIGY